VMLYGNGPLRLPAVDGVPEARRSYVAAVAK
jgi:hypothetical protein